MGRQEEEKLIRAEGREGRLFLRIFDMIPLKYALHKTVAISLLFFFYLKNTAPHHSRILITSSLLLTTHTCSNCIFSKGSYKLCLAKR